MAVIGNCLEIRTLTNLIAEINLSKLFEETQKRHLQLLATAGAASQAGVGQIHQLQDSGKEK